jgi:uncharacterized protein YqjF (DUF2071 family)
MNAVSPTLDFSARARQRFLAAERRPRFLGDWERALFIHYETDPELLQRQVPFELDLWQGRAFVSVVAFSMRRFRAAGAGNFLERVFRPVANHEFLNVRTYVRNAGLTGIYFIAEWVNNIVSLITGPPLYGLPYRYGRIDYRHHHEVGLLTGGVADAFAYEATLPAGIDFQPCPRDGIEEFLLERYTAFTCGLGVRRVFNIWHEPWRQSPVEVKITDGLLRQSGAWFGGARRIGSNYSPGATDIWMGAPRRLA